MGIHLHAALDELVAGQFAVTVDVQLHEDPIQVYKK